jgi:hypothetical protein
MAKLRITAQDGKTYMLTVPDGMSAEDAVTEFESDVLGNVHKTSLDTSDVRSAAKGWASREPDKPVYVPGDITKSFGTGVAQGAMGIAGLSGLAEWGIRKGINFAGGNVSEDPALPTYGDIKGAVEGVTGELPQPKSTVGEYARTAGEFAPGMIGPGGFVPKLLSTAGGALASETAGQITEGTAAEPWARAGAGIAGALAPSVALRAAAPIKQLGEEGAERARLAATLDAEGVPMTAGQRTGSMPLRWAESIARDTPGGSRNAKQLAEQQGEAFTHAALKRIGEDANRATPEVMAAARARIGGAFDDFAKGREVRFDATAARKLDEAWDAYTGAVAPSHQVPNVARSLDDFRPAIDAVKKGETPIISAEQYSSWRSDLSRRLSETTDDNARKALGRMIDTLDDALQRSAGPEAAKAIGEARRQYKHLVTLEKVAAGASEGAAQGILSPQALANKVTATDAGKRAYAQGKGDFADLARAGRALLKPLPQSGTAPRLGAQTVMSVAGGFAGGPVGAIAPAVSQALASRLLMSKPVQKYLGNAARGQRYAASREGAPMAGAKGAAVDASATEDKEAKQRRLLEILMRRRGQ